MAWSALGTAKEKGERLSLGHERLSGIVAQWKRLHRTWITGWMTKKISWFYKERYELEKKKQRPKEI